MTNRFKLGTAQYSYLFDYSLEDALREISSIGLKYLELMTTPPHIWAREFSSHQRRGLRNLMVDLGLQPVAVNPTYLDINLASPNPGMREESVRQIFDQIDLAHDLGAGIVVLIAGRRHSLLAPSFEEVWEKYARDSLKRCAEHARKKEVILGLENGPGLFVETSQRLLFILNELNSPGVGIVYDVANASVAEPIEDGFETIKDHLVHVHLSDTDYKTWTHSAIGDGNINFSAVADKLREIRYTGCSILETTVNTNPTRHIEDSVEKLIPLGWRK